MKRFFILVSLVALVATGCTKTIIKNEVETPISFSTESGKLTRAIVNDANYLESQPFGVFAFANQEITEGQTTTYTTTEFMSNVEITKQDLYKSEGVAGQDGELDTWRPATGSYYWPNDPRTTVNFYAYSPFIGTNKQEVADHQKMVVSDFAQVQDVPNTDENENNLSFGYTHNNMYVDFMVATPVERATYSAPGGNNPGKVPLSFHHQMTQIVFTVKTNAAYSDINFAVQSITLKDVTKTANYVQDYVDNYGAWSETAKGDFKIFPTFKAQGAPNDDAYNYIYKPNQEVDGIGGKQIKNAGEGWILTTQAVTMIPQTLKASAAAQGGNAVVGQKFEIVYSIDGTGVASEVVKKTLDIYVDNNSPQWEANKKITYNVVIGLNEITFEPSVAKWDDGTGEGDTDPYHQDFTFQQ